MRRGFAWLLFILSSYVLICASSDQLMKWLSNNRSTQTEILTSDKYTYGDLYGFSYLPQFQIKTILPSFLKPVENLQVRGGNDLYILGDSYLYSFFKKSPAYFAQTKQLSFLRWTEDTLLDAQKIKAANSILLIECVERNAFSRLKLSEVTARLGVNSTSKNNSQLDIGSNYAPTTSSINEWIKLHFYHPTLENNLDFVLFSRGIYRTFKEWKASLTNSLFDRTDNFVTLSKDGSFLYLKETVDSTQMSSSFYPISEKELDDLVANLNEINAYYLKAGFKKVLISIPANPVAILQTEDKPTNQFLNRLKKHPNLHVDLIDPSDSLKINASQNYFKSDSHWNTNGAKIWLAYLNRSLEKI